MDSATAAQQGGGFMGILLSILNAARDLPGAIGTTCALEEAQQNHVDHESNGGRITKCAEIVWDLVILGS